MESPYKDSWPDSVCVRARARARVCVHACVCVRARASDECESRTGSVTI